MGNNMEKVHTEKGFSMRCNSGDRNSGDRFIIRGNLGQLWRP